MINWYRLLANSLWIIALALDLSILSYSRWRAWQGDGQFGDLIKSPGILWTVNLSGFLFCVGLLLLSFPWWEKSLWGVFGILFLYLMIFGRRDLGQ